MKRFLLILLTVLLLAGCAKRPLPPTDTGDSQENHESTDWYIPNSAMEEQTAGAVRMYALAQDTYSGIYSMGSNLLLVGQKELTVLSGEEGRPVAAMAVNAPYTSLHVAATGIAYYQADARKVTVLNPQLQTVTQLEMPETIVNSPIISLVRNEVYYSTGSEIRALNITTGISRLLRQQTAGGMLLLGSYFDGAVLALQLTNETKTKNIEYISSETGQTLSNSQGISGLQTYGDSYFVKWQDGAVSHTVFGSRGADAQRFLLAQPDDTNGGVTAVLGMNGAVAYTETDAGTQLSFYHFNTGKRTAQVNLPGIKCPKILHSDSRYIWILAEDKAASGQALYRWDIHKSPTEDETHYTAPLYTADKPDTEGLAQCQAQADAYGKQYGVKLAIWQNAVAHTGGHAVTAEHNPQIISQMLEKIQPVLALFPEKFLLKTVENGWIRISLVRSIDGEDGWAQFWEGGDCWILLSAQGEIADSLLKGMAYGIDSHVLGNSRDFDTWSQLNPEGFVYSYGQQPEAKTEYLEGENRAFTDQLAMRYPHEDRCRVFYHAMRADNGDMFQSPILQAKLLQLCKGIREAYGLEKKTVTYPWEQYLQTSLAYVAK